MIKAKLGRKRREYFTLGPGCAQARQFVNREIPTARMAGAEPDQCHFAHSPCGRHHYWLS